MPGHLAWLSLLHLSLQGRKQTQRGREGLAKNVPDSVPGACVLSATGSPPEDRWGLPYFAEEEIVAQKRVPASGTVSHCYFFPRTLLPRRKYAQFKSPALDIVGAC